jgi:hypothetical protein
LNVVAVVAAAASDLNFKSLELSAFSLHFVYFGSYIYPHLTMFVIFGHHTQRRGDAMRINSIIALY